MGLTLLVTLFPYMTKGLFTPTRIWSDFHMQFVCSESDQCEKKVDAELINSQHKHEAQGMD